MNNQESSHSTSYDPIPFTNSSDIERIFGRKGQISYIKNLENTILDKNNLESLSWKIIDQLVWLAKQADKGTILEQDINSIPQDVSNKEFLRELFAKNYGVYAKILPENDTIASFIAYQEDTQNNIMKIFKTHIDKPYRWWQLSSHLIEWLLLESKKDIQIKELYQEEEISTTTSLILINLFQHYGYDVDKENLIIKHKTNKETMTELVKKYWNGPLWKSISWIIQDKTKKEEKRKKEEEEKNMREKNMETFNLLMYGHDGKNLPPAARQVHHKGWEESEYF